LWGDRAMNLLLHVRWMALYNQGMNVQIYDAAAGLSVADLARDRGAFFGSILGTLNHLVVADVVWLKRFAAHPVDWAALAPVRSMVQPAALSQIVATDFGVLRSRREMLDRAIVDWVASLGPDDLDLVLDYQNMQGVPARRQLGALLCHFFNHQTHHRGQVTTLLSQVGLDVGVTDLLDRLPGFDVAQPT
jgi:uncharacterized damage-inducible protein DinB